MTAVAKQVTRVAKQVTCVAKQLTRVAKHMTAPCPGGDQAASSGKLTR